MNPPKIAFLLYSMTGGGIERTVSILLKHLAEKHEIYLVLFNEPIEYELPPNIKVKYLRRNFQSRFLRLFTLPLVTFRYWRFCKKQNIHKSISFDSICNFTNCVLKLFAWQEDCYIYEANYASVRFPTTTWHGRIHRFLIRKLYPLSDKLLVNTARIADDLAQQLGLVHHYVKLVPNPLDLQVIHIQSPTFIPKQVAFVFLHVGGFRQQKNHALLIDAFAQLGQLDAVLLLLGKGELEQQIRSKVAEMGLKSRVFFEGFQSNPYAYMQQADCMVLSSDYEGSPNVLLEGLACGLPIISTDCPSGPRELLAPDSDINTVLKRLELAKYGILTPPGDATQLAAAMQLLYGNRTLRQQYCTIAQERVSAFEASRVARDFESLLEE